MEHTTYSFEDCSLVFKHKAVGTFTFTGKGIGSVSISRSNDVSAHDLAADGSVMTSKITAKNGLLAIAIQQTSSGHKFLKKWYDYLTTAPSSEWTKATAVLKNPAIGETINIKGICPQKRPDASFQSSGQQVTWNLMAHEIDG